MDDDGRYRDGRSDFIRGAKDIAKVAKKQVGKKMGRGVDKMADEYTKRSYKRFEEEDDDDDYAGMPSNDGGYYRNDSRANDDEGHSDSTEGHDEDDEIYEGEYQGIPRAESGKASGMDGVAAPQAQQFRDLSAYEGERREDQKELAQQYETILQECGHGKFQWTLYFVLGLALMADGVEIFVVGFVLPSAEKDMCLSEPNKGMLGKIYTLLLSSRIKSITLTNRWWKCADDTMLCLWLLSKCFSLNSSSRLPRPASVYFHLRASFGSSCRRFTFYFHLILAVNFTAYPPSSNCFSTVVLAEELQLFDIQLLGQFVDGSRILNQTCSQFKQSVLCSSVCVL